MELSTEEAQVWSLTALPLCWISLQSVQVKMSWESHFLSSVKTHTHTQNPQLGFVGSWRIGMRNHGVTFQTRLWCFFHVWCHEVRVKDVVFLGICAHVIRQYFLWLCFLGCVWLRRDLSNNRLVAIPPNLFVLLGDLLQLWVLFAPTHKAFMHGMQDFTLYECLDGVLTKVLQIRHEITNGKFHVIAKSWPGFHWCWGAKQSQCSCQAVEDLQPVPLKSSLNSP